MRSRSTASRACLSVLPLYPTLGGSSCKSSEAIRVTLWHGHGSLNAIFQLTHIAWPMVSFNLCLDFLTDLAIRWRKRSASNMMAPPRSFNGDRDGHSIEAIVKSSLNRPWAMACSSVLSSHLLDTTLVLFEDRRSLFYVCSCHGHHS